jgi:uncharacterized membrane protein YccC
MVATSVVLIQAVAYQHPEQLAFIRWVDVLIGCVIGTLFAITVPLWKRESLAANTAAYADAIAEWVQLMAHAVEHQPAEREPEIAQIRQAGVKARNARQVAVTTFNTALLEPPTRQLDTGAVGIVLSWIRRTSDAAVAAEALLRHSVPASSTGSLIAEATALDLRTAADVLRGTDTPISASSSVNTSTHGIGDAATSTAQSSPTTLSRHALDEPGADRFTVLMARAEISATSAVRASRNVLKEKQREH